MLSLRVVVVIVVLAAGVDAQAPPFDTQAIAGSWGVDGRTLLELTVDRGGTVGGAATFYSPGAASVTFPVSGRFDTRSGGLSLDAQVSVPGAAAPVKWTLTGSLTGDAMRVTMVLGPTTLDRVLSRVNTRSQALAAAADQAGTVLITGANRGLGLEFTRQYAAAGWRVIATARDPANAKELQTLAGSNGRVTVEKLDLLDRPGIQGLAAKYRTTPIDVVLNNAGVLGEMKAQQLGALDYTEFEEVMAVNVFGALAVAQAFQEPVAASRQKKIVSLTSRSGIISLPGSRGPYFYRASKTALNMVMRVLADDLRSKGVIVALVSPPPTDTEMLRTLIGPQGAAQQARPEASVTGMIKVIAGLSAAQSGGPPIYFDGTTLPW